MTRDRWSRVQTLFVSAAEDPLRCSPQWLERECGDDRGLLNEVLRLLRNDSALAEQRRLVPVASALIPDHAGRFEERRLIGSGGFGDVYSAYDLKRKERVAVKHLRVKTADALLRFKQESRLPGIRHPNLIRIHELLYAGSEWLIVMELIEGANVVSATESCSGGGRFELVRRIMEQIALGIEHLHTNDILHRDIKPSNVLLTPEGRVVLLDFGLAKIMDKAGEDSSRELIGAPDYVSPEQVAGQPLTGATDWYSAGVILYLLLTGRQPFQSAAGKVLSLKTETDPLNPCVVNSAVPRELGDLCAGLLDRNPATRFGYREVMATAALNLAKAHPSSERSETRLYGRAAELGTLGDAFRDVERARTAVCVCATGESGVGKTELIQTFLKSLLLTPAPVLVLRGRCFEAESVPYKAFDAVLDALVRDLAGLDRPSLNAVLPHDFEALVQVFPVFGKLDDGGSAVSGWKTDDPAGQRRAGFRALRQLFDRLARIRRVVMFIDDLHWGDLESVELMASLLSGPDLPCMLTIVAWPRDQSGAPLPALLSEFRGPGAEIRRLPIEPLGDKDSLDLTKALMPGAAEPAIEWVQRGSRNIPFLIQELARYCVRGLAQPDEMTPEGAIASRADALEPRARSLLRLVAVAEGPLPENVIRSAAGICDGYHSARDRLVDARLVRITGSQSLPSVDIYHARQRSVLAATVSGEDAAELHRRIANALEKESAADPEHIYLYLRKAGENQRAATYASIAGDHAASRFAFGRAARLFEAAINLRPAVDSEAAALWRRLGDARAGEGLGEQAADAYLKAAEADPAAAFDMQILAAEQLLRSGSLDAGFRALAGVSRRAKLPWARTRTGLLVSLLALRLRLRFARWRRGAQDPGLADPPASLHQQIRICWVGTVGTGMTDPLRSAAYSTRHLLLAAKSNDKAQLCRAFAAEAAHALPEILRVASPAELMSEARRLSRETGNQSAQAFVTFMDGIIACSDGHWQDCIELCSQALDLYRRSTSGMGWDRTTASAFILSSQILLGEWKTAASNLPLLVREAEERGDRYAAVNLPLLTSSFWPLLARGEAQRARSEAHRLLQVWDERRREQLFVKRGHSPFDLQDFYAFNADVDSRLYLGDAAGALAVVRATWPRLTRAGMLHMPLIRVQSYYLAAKARIAAACVPGVPEKSALLSEAARFGSKLQAQPQYYAVAIGRALQAAVRSVQTGPSAELLERAEPALDQARLIPWWAACRAHRNGTWEEDPWFRTQGVTDAYRLAHTLLPGRWG